MIPGVDAVTDVFKGLIGLGSEYIEDKDKRNEFLFKTFEAKAQLESAILSLKTTPKVDAFVKILYAMNSLWRPIGGAVMTGFGIYAHIKGIPIDTTLHAVFDGAFPAWGVSRHIYKKKGGA